MISPFLTNKKTPFNTLLFDIFIFLKAGKDIKNVSEEIDEFL